MYLTTLPVCCPDISGKKYRKLQNLLPMSFKTHTEQIVYLKLFSEGDWNGWQFL